MKYITITKQYLYGVPEENYQQLLKDTDTKKLHQLEEDTEEFKLIIDTLEEVSEQKHLQQIRINDEEY